jgi:hypothetical protein
MRGIDNTLRSVRQAVLSTPPIVIHGVAHKVTRSTERNFGLEINPFREGALGVRAEIPLRSFAAFLPVALHREKVRLWQQR